GGLCALGQPVAHALLVDLDGRRVGLRVVLAEDLDHATVARGALVGGDDAPDRILLPTHTGEPESNCQESLLVGKQAGAERADVAREAGPARKARIRLAALPHHRPEIGHTAAGNLLHDLAHLPE